MRLAPTAYGPGSVLWQVNLPGIAGLGALRGLLRQASAVLGEDKFPYTLVADALLDQQMAVFGGGACRRNQAESTARRWGQGVWLDMIVREGLTASGIGDKSMSTTLYPEYVRFAGLMGVAAELLPARPGEFLAWADCSLGAGQPEDYRKLALDCLTELSPLFWPVNIALIFYLLPEEFMVSFGDRCSGERRHLADMVEGIFTDLSGN